MAKLSSHSVTAEVIRFMSPQSERTNLYVTGLMELKLSSEQIYVSSLCITAGSAVRLGQTNLFLFGLQSYSYTT